MNRLWQLKGQKKPPAAVKKGSKKKSSRKKGRTSSTVVDDDNPTEFPITTQEKLFNSLQPTEVYEVLLAVQRGTIGLKEISDEIDARVRTNCK